MSLRGFGGQTTVGASAQPVFGTTLSAATVLNPDIFSGNTNPGSNRSSCVVSLAAGTAGRFRSGDRVLIGTAVQFEQGNTVQAGGGTVVSVNASGNTITVQGLTRNHASGEFCILALPVSSWTLQLLSGTLYVGEDGTVGASSSTLCYLMYAGGIQQLGLSNIANVLEVQHIWAAGPGAIFIPSFVTI